MPKKLLITLIQTAFLTVTFSVCSKAKDYFPLEIGNTWVYDILMIPDTYDTTRITKKVAVDGRIYHVFESTFFYCDRLLRRDANNNILMYVEYGVEDTLYKLGASIDDTWQYGCFTATFLGTVSVAVETPAGDFEKCLFFYYDSDVCEFMGHYLAPEVGHIYSSGFNFGMRIVWAEVNGVVYPGTTGLYSEQNPDIPLSFILYQNYSNPFNSVTRIEFSIRSARYEAKSEIFNHVVLSIFNTLGQRVITLLESELPTGRYEVTWNGENEEGGPVASGIYLYRLTVGDYTAVRKLVLLH